MNIQLKRFINILTYAHSKPHSRSFFKFFIKSLSSFLDLCNLLFLGLTPRTVFCNLPSLGLKDSAKRRKKQGRGDKIHLILTLLDRTDIDGFPSTWQPSLTFSSRAAILSFRWSWRRSLDSVRSLSTVSESRLLCSSFIFSLCRAWRNKVHKWRLVFQSLLLSTTPLKMFAVKLQVTLNKLFPNFLACDPWKQSNVYMWPLHSSCVSLPVVASTTKEFSFFGLIE